MTIYGAALALGLLLLGTALVIVLGDRDGMSKSMPTQVPPRRLARYPAALGATLAVIGLVGLIAPR